MFFFFSHCFFFCGLFFWLCLGKLFLFVLCFGLVFLVEVIEGIVRFLVHVSDTLLIRFLEELYVMSFFLHSFLK